MPNSTYDYDMLIIGSGPAGHRAAIQASKLGKRACVIEKQTALGGVCINTGTIPSKSLREAALRLSGYREREIYGASYVKSDVTMGQLLFRVDQVIHNEIDVIRHQLQRNHIEFHNAMASFVDPHRVHVTYADGTISHDITAEYIVIAVGTTPAKDAKVYTDQKNVFTSDDLLQMDEVPRTMTVIGAGVIGLEYACIFASLGVQVTVIDKNAELLPFVDREIIDALVYHLRENDGTIHMNEQVSSVEPFQDPRGPRVRVNLASGKQFVTQKVLYSIGRAGNIEGLNLAAAGIEADARGRLKVNDNYQTVVPHIYAVGDIIGFPSLASTSMEQGRLASCHAFGVSTHSMPDLLPFGIFTVPGISMVGKTEEDLTKANVPYAVGRAHYKEIARGQILGDHTGLLKLIFHRETRALLGVHIIGTEAAELVHIGQAALALNGTIDFFVQNVFNYPTLAECYKTAAFDGINRMGL